MPAVLAEDAQYEVLLFQLQRETFGLPLASVLEVLRAVAIRRLPNAPAVVEGIIDVRGDLVPVLDVRSRFRLPPKPLELSDHFVVAEAGERRVALRVDRALDLTRVRAVDIRDATNLPRGVTHVFGIASLPEGLVLLHDLAAFLSEAESLTLERALHELPSFSESAR
jgi:purine-binding chemotaxis protein CheW